MEYKILIKKRHKYYLYIIIKININYNLIIFILDSIFIIKYI